MVLSASRAKLRSAGSAPETINERSEDVSEKFSCLLPPSSFLLLVCSNEEEWEATENLDLEVWSTSVALCTLPSLYSHPL